MSFAFNALLGANHGAGFDALGVNQGQVDQTYNQAQSGVNQQQAFVNALNAQNGLGNQANVFGQQQALANQLQNIGNGAGPNPAQAALNQATGQNVANQAALMASQRGANANAGLLARQIANQGANIQQQAAGQSATLQAQQQLGALGALQNQQGMLAGQANQQVTQQAQGLQGLNAASQGLQGNVYGLQGNQNSTNAGIAGINAKNNADILGGILKGASSGIAAAAAYKGGMVPSYAEGGPVNAPKSFFGNMLKGMTENTSAPKPYNELGDGVAQLLGNVFAHGGKVPAMVSPGEIYLSPEEAKDPKRAAQMAKLKEMKGQKIPGKAEIKGDSLKNDKVKAELEPGGIVIPRSHSMDPEKAAAFARQVAMKNRRSLGQ